MKSDFKVWVVLVAISLVAPAVAWADFSATVTPGYVFYEGEVPTTAKLNRLARPTIYITGTLSGTNILGAQTVVAANLGPDVVESGYGLVFGTGGGLAVDPSAIAGAGLREVAANKLAVNVDSNYVIFSGTNLTLSIPALSNAVRTVSQVVTTAQFSLVSGGTVVSVAHGLGATPSDVRFVLVCTDTDAGFAAGDEIDVEGVVVSATYAPAFVYGANATAMFCVEVNTTAIGTLNKGSGALAALTGSKWKVKGYARP